VLVPATLLAFGGLVARPDSVLRTAAAFALIVGAGATFSRGGALAGAAGFALLAGLLDVRVLVRAVAPAVLGALVALAGLVPSMPTGASSRPLLAGLSLLAGLALSGAALRAPRILGLLVALGVGPMVVLVVRNWSAIEVIANTRLSLASPDRGATWSAALRLWQDHPIVGTGPGAAELTWTATDGARFVAEYAHNEYLQVLAELGSVGFVLLAGLGLSCIAAVRRALRGVRRLRPTDPIRCVVAAAAAGLLSLTIGSALDFYWHIPALIVLAALLLGITTTPQQRPPPAEPAH
jgi:O-antigen ligase